MHRIIRHRAALACLLFSLNAVAQPERPSSAGVADTSGQLTSSPSLPKAMRAANRALSKRVLKALSHVKGLDATGIFVKATGDSITLSGVVQNAEQIPLAVDATRKVEGVDAVHEYLRLTTQPVR